jgi:hypothetical protein
VVIVVTDAELRTNRCTEHKGQRATVETDEQRVARVCAAMGWRRTRNG